MPNRQTQFSEYTFIGSTSSLCPTCLQVVPAKIITRGQRVYFRKRCSQCGPREDFVCSDINYFDQTQYALPSKLPQDFGVQPNRGCPYDCGLCSEHEQHTCIALIEINSNCNLKCPMCFATSGPGGTNLSYNSCCRSIDRIVQLEGRAEVIQLSGGEPTIHPDFERVLRYATGQPVDYVMINTNGIRLANDQLLVDEIANYQGRVEVYLQMDGLGDEVNQKLRGQPLLDQKLRAIERLGQADVHTTLAVTLQGGVNDDQLGPLVEFAVARPWITGISFQPATYSGRHVLPDDIENRITFPDVVKGIDQQTDGLFAETDFMPLPCAHPNCHTISIAYRSGGKVTPLARFIDTKSNLDLLANGISFTREKSKGLMKQLVGRWGSCPEGACSPADQKLSSQSGINNTTTAHPVAFEFFSRALRDALGAKDLFRITITSFLDAYNFDLRRLMKCCTHHVLPSGHVIPFCAYNVLYREGHVALPALKRQQNSDGVRLYGIQK